MRSLFLIAACAALASLPAEAQFVNYIGPGSTPAGDYLRGMGIAADGFGSYNLKTAMAESIHLDSEIRLDRYIGEVMIAGRIRYAKYRRQVMDRLKAGYNAARQRIRENPMEGDMLKGDALNAIIEQLNAPDLSSSAFRLTPVPISIEDIRRIPFHRGDRNIVFSMQRLSFRGKGKWPVALQDDFYAAERKRYEAALDDALEHMVDRKMPDEVIKTYVSSIEGLSAKLDQKFGPNSRELHYNEAKTRLREMAKSAELLKSSDLQPALAELDSYGGTTVNDLRLFMQRHSLRFASASSRDERELYPRLYEALVAVREVVLDRSQGEGK
ncbi:hypothetical protein TA3x_002073 [Tundrisphaera sp. TA3]|uniref:hypothetical protein n=1 Tax=Tundrisphaera sp. TA3 TaxID=3435775 RepID=UPI003EB92CA4